MRLPARKGVGAKWEAKQNTGDMEHEGEKCLSVSGEKSNASRARTNEALRDDEHDISVGGTNGDRQPSVFVCLVLGSGK